MTLTARQQEILDFIGDQCAQGNPPTVREIMVHFGFSGPNGVNCHLRALEKKGAITNSGLARGVRPVDGPLDALRREAEYAVRLLRRQAGVVCREQAERLQAALARCKPKEAVDGTDDEGAGEVH